MELRYWPKWLQEADQHYQADGDRKRMYGRVRWWENKNDQLECLRMASSDMMKMQEIHQAFNDIWDGKYRHPALTEEEYKLYGQSRPVMKAGEIDPLPHISTLLADRPPFKEFREKWPDMYKTLISWVWG